MVLLINRKDLMGEWVNPPWYNFVSWISVVIVVGLSLALTAIGPRGM
jgi:Mn2+/Fe2+ NRAMP family transporter